MTTRPSTESNPRSGKGSLYVLFGLLAGGGLLAFALFAPGLDTPRTLPPPPPKAPSPDVSRIEPRVAEAIRKARESVLADLEHADAWILLAKTLDVHDQYAEAAEAYREGIRLRPGDSELNYLRGVVLWHVPDGAAEAEAIMRRTTELQPKYPPPWARLGTWMASQRRYDDARAAFERAIEIDSTFAYAHRELGRTMIELGLPDTAMSALTRAAAIVPADREVHDLTARIHHWLGNTEEAAMSEELARRYDDLIKLNDPVRDALDLIGVSGWHCFRRALGLMKEGKFEEANRELVTVRGTIWDDPDVHLGLADMYDFRGKKLEALREYREVLRLREDDPRANLGVAKHLTERQQFSTAVDHWRVAVEAFPHDGQARLGFANALAATGDAQGAAEQYEKAAELVQPTAEVLTNWATALMRMGSSDEAIARYKQAIDLDPDFADAHYNLGAAYEKLGRKVDAITEYRFGAMLDPKHPGAKRIEELEGADP